MELKVVYTLLHILGAVLGAGGAFVSDALFFSCMKDKTIDASELRLLKVASTVVWVGLAIAIVSGLLLFSLDPQKYLASSKFLVKMTVVLIIALNGILFHHSHIPRIARHVGEYLPSSPEFMSKSSLLFASGAVSLVSWLSALVLGTLRSIPYSYAQGLGIYLAALAIAIAGSLIFKKKVLG